MDQTVLCANGINEIFVLTVRFANANEMRSAASKRYLVMTQSVAPTLLLAIGLANAQQTVTARPQFEVVSVRRNTAPPGLTGIHFSPGGRFTATNVPLKLLIEIAYKAATWQDSKWPGWIESDSARYDIAARAEGDPAQDKMLLMLQTMLEDRFKVKVHRETKEVPVYALVVAKGGPKLLESKASSCVEVRPGDIAPDPAALPLCGRIGIIPNGIAGTKVTMTELAGVLPNIAEVGRPVIDKTGITATFDVYVRWGDSAGSSIFTALAEQLGVKLESQKGPGEIFIIDHAERPKEN